MGDKSLLMGDAVNIPDAPLPPWLRRVQQTYLAQVVVLPILMGFGSSMLISGCIADGIDHITRACVMGSINSTLAAFLTAVFSGHSPGSASFNKDGTKKDA
jgi:hypothetical protein